MSFCEKFDFYQALIESRATLSGGEHRLIDQCLDGEIDKYFEVTHDKTPGRGSESKLILSVVMREYLENKSTTEISKEDFRKGTIPQHHTYLYAGHETTSNTLMCCQRELFNDSTALDRVCTEHDKVSGARHIPRTHTKRIFEDTTLLNHLSCTLEAIKEILCI